MRVCVRVKSGLVTGQAVEIRVGWLAADVDRAETVVD